MYVAQFLHDCTKTRHISCQNRAEIFDMRCSTSYECPCIERLPIVVGMYGPHAFSVASLCGDHRAGKGPIFRHILVTYIINVLHTRTIPAGARNSPSGIHE